MLEEKCLPKSGNLPSQIEQNLNILRRSNETKETMVFQFLKNYNMVSINFLHDKLMEL